MAKQTFTIEIDDDYEPSLDDIPDARTYVEHVMNMAAKSYANHPDADTPLEGIELARQLANEERAAQRPVEAPEEGGEA